MIKPEQIPDEVILAYITHQSKAGLFSIPSAIAAALNAWPGAQKNVLPAFNMETGRHERPVLILPLPLPQEKNDE